MGETIADPVIKTDEHILLQTLELYSNYNYTSRLTDVDRFVLGGHI